LSGKGKYQSVKNKVMKYCKKNKVLDHFFYNDSTFTINIFDVLQINIINKLDFYQIINIRNNNSQVILQE